MTAPNSPPVLSVSQITQAIKTQLESSFPQVWIQGEISNFKAQSSGHLYFSLKDKQAQISCAMFRGSTGGLQRMPRDGDQVIVQGQVNVYPPRGNYQLIIRTLTFSGLGQLLLQLEKLKQKLKAEGLFDPQHKQSLPKFPRRIGIVTSPTGAAIQDMLNILNRRFAGVHVILNPVRVQGVEAAGEIATAIQDFNTHDLADVLIVGRGGGSIEDLWSFNEEIVARAIFQSKIPIISAVGHETDYSLADLAADVRAPTPSAAAELVVSEKTQHLESLKTAAQRLDNLLRHFLQVQMQRLDELRNSIDRSMLHGLQRRRLYTQGLQRQTFALNPKTQLIQSRQRLQQLTQALDLGLLRQIQFQRQSLQRINQNLRAIDPQNLLQKGYSILFSEKNGSVISSVQALATSDKVRARLSDGELTATLTDIEVQCPTKNQKN